MKETFSFIKKGFYVELILSKYIVLRNISVKKNHFKKASTAKTEYFKVFLTSVFVHIVNKSPNYEQILLTYIPMRDHVYSCLLYYLYS